MLIGAAIGGGFAGTMFAATGRASYIIIGAVIPVIGLAIGLSLDRRQVTG
jgi:hypothetical protein